MAIWHNCSDGWLKRKAFKPYLILLGVVVTATVIYGLMYWGASATKNSIAMLITLGGIFYAVRESKRMKRYIDRRTRTYRVGWFGEFLVRMQLKRLPDTYHVFYDVRFNEDDGNIDYIVVCDLGVYTIEVKNHSSGKLRSSWYGKEKSQAMDEARTLHSVLVEHGIDSQWVTSVLVRADQIWKLQTRSEDVDVLGLFSIKKYFKDQQSMRNEKLLSPKNIDTIVSVIIKNAVGFDSNSV